MLIVRSKGAHSSGGPASNPVSEKLSLKFSTLVLLSRSYERHDDMRNIVRSLHIVSGPGQYLG